MPIAQRNDKPTRSDIELRHASLRRASARRCKLERLFADVAFLDDALSDGRYLRLCAAIAWASAREQEARQGVEAEWGIARLRARAIVDRCGAGSFRSTS